MHTVGVSNRTRYWQQYVFTHPPKGYRYTRMLDIPWHVFRVRDQFLVHTKFHFPFKRVDLLHTYNSIVANRMPWVVEVESYLPRYKPMKPGHPLYRWGTRRLASGDCKALLFTSRNSMDQGRDALVAAGVDPAKMHVVYRAVERYTPLPRSRDAFTILFAGNGFYRKGGLELLKAFQRLGRSEVRLIIVSNLEVDWGTRPSPADIAWAESFIAGHPGITLYRKLEHHVLIDLMRRAHLFVSTTFADPFNNTILEAMGCGLPVVASRMGSVREMVEEGRNGVLIDVQDRQSDAIADELALAVKRLMDDGDLLAQWSSASRTIAWERFDLEVRNSDLGRLYDQALR